MVIPETQLETWSHQGAVATSKATQESIKIALDQYKGYPENIDYEVYLQGSYRNSTNIRGDSDVDVIVELKSSFYGDTSTLPSNESSLYKSIYPDATYKWQNFRSNVLSALQDYYGNSVIKEGRKSLKVGNPTGSRLPADVVVCMQYRKYLEFPNFRDQKYVEGVQFYVPSENRWIISYPKLHYENGVKKHSPSATNGWYKPAVRIFKNARSYLIDHDKISSDVAPSHFLEGLIYNVPNDKFGTSYQNTFYNILKWACNVDYSQIVCQNEQLPLFGHTPEQWSEANAHQLISSLISLWNDW